MKSAARVLAIVGGAFLIGTGQAVFFGPISLKEPTTTTGTEGVKGDPNRVPKQMESPSDADSEPVPPEVIAPEIVEPEVRIDGTDDPMNLESAVKEAIADPIPDDVLPTAAFAGIDDLLDAPVPEGTLTLRESKSLWDQGAYFIDARHQEEFDAGHIQYAALLLAQWFDTDPDRAFAVTDSIPTDATIVIYCVGGECDASKNTAAWLEPLGYTDLRIMGAGYEHWVEAGFETETTPTDGGAP